MFVVCTDDDERYENGVSKEEEECYGWLEEIEVPENSHMDGIEYLGPEIIDDSRQ